MTSVLDGFSLRGERRRAGVDVGLAMNIHRDFAEAVHGCSDLPEVVRAAIGNVQGLEESVFDESYLEFLDQQIGLGARGPEWTERLRGRRQGLAGWANRPLINGHIRLGNDEYWIKVDQSAGIVAYGEKYEDMYEPTRPT